MKPVLSSIRAALQDWAKSDFWQQSSQLAEECWVINLKRVTMLTMVTMLVNLVSIAQFILTPPGAALNEKTWRQLIILAHAALFVIMLVTNLLSIRLRRTNSSAWLARNLHHIMALAVIMAGVAISAIDQLVNDNVTAYLVACLMVGIFFLIRPDRTLILYLAGFFALAFAIGRLQLLPAAMLSCRVNGFAAAALGFVISDMMWRSNITNFMQKTRIAEQQTELEQKNSKLEQMAFSDFLTTLPNRFFFDQVILKETALIQRDGHQSCLIMLDIDYFKNVNDTFGHPVGDSILHDVALLLQSRLRQSDLIARLGGEEFLILLPNTSLTGAKFTAEKLREAIENEPFAAGDQTARITASFGVGQLIANPDKKVNYYAACDQALYRAKQNGRNRVEVTGQS